MYDVTVLQYLAPEVLRKQPYDKTVDWWCLGAVTYEMIYGLVSHVTSSSSFVLDTAVCNQMWCAL